MPKEYCMKCGFGTDYSVTKPTACKKCNTALVAPTSVIASRQAVKTEAHTRAVESIINQNPAPFVIHDRAGNSIDLSQVNPQRLLKELNLEPIGEDELNIENTTDVNLASMPPLDRSESTAGRGKRKRGSRKQAATLAKEFFSEGNGQAAENGGQS